MLTAVSNNAGSGDFGLGTFHHDAVSHSSLILLHRQTF